jgi:hypothetical protein
MNRYTQFSRLLVALIILIPGLCSACTTKSLVQEALGIVAETPVFLDCKAITPQELHFTFSRPVTVNALRFSSPVQGGFRAVDGETVRVLFDKEIDPGLRLTADILVEDKAGNTLNVLAPLMSRNEHLPKLIITELRTENSKPRVEFIELYAQTRGNIGALRLFAAGNNAPSPLFEFPSLWVNAGDYIVLYLRTPDYEGAYKEVHPKAHFFKLDGSKNHIKKDAGAVYLMDQDDRVLDAVVFYSPANKKGETAWNAVAETALFLSQKGAWAGPRLEDAVPSKDSTATKTICRHENRPDTNSAIDWYIVDHKNNNPGPSPGSGNNRAVYVSK